MAKKLGAHHGSKGEGNERRNQDGDSESDGKFAKQAADNVAHEEQRNEDGDQRNRQRQDGEADLFRAF